MSARRRDRVAYGQRMTPSKRNVRTGPTGIHRGVPVTPHPQESWPSARRRLRRRARRLGLDLFHETPAQALAADRDALAADRDALTADRDALASDRVT